MQNKLNNIQALRGFAVLLVVGLHILAIEIKYSQFDVLLPEFLRIGISGVDLFFIISGFIMVTVTQGNHQQSRFFLYQRLSRIFPLYWLVTSAILLAYFYDDTLVNFTRFDASFVFNSYLLQPQHSLPVLMVGWSLIHELYFYIIFSFFLLLPRKSLPLLLLTWLAVIIIGNKLLKTEHHILSAYTRIIFSPLTVEFIAGCFLALFLKQKTTQQQPHLKQLFSFLFPLSIWLAVIWSLLNITSTLFSPVELLSEKRLILILELFVLLLIVFLLQEKKSNRNYPFALSSFVAGLVFLVMIWNRFSFNTTEVDIEGWPRVYLFTPPYLLLMYGALALEKNNQSKNKGIAHPWLIAIGDASYSIYLTHILILSALGHLWFLIASDSIFDNIIMLLLMLIAVFVGGFLCFHYVEKPLLRLSHRATLFKNVK